MHGLSRRRRRDREVRGNLTAVASSFLLFVWSTRRRDLAFVGRMSNGDVLAVAD